MVWALCWAGPRGRGAARASHHPSGHSVPHGGPWGGHYIVTLRVTPLQTDFNLLHAATGHNEVYSSALRSACLHVSTRQRSLE